MAQPNQNKPTKQTNKRQQHPHSFLCSTLPQPPESGAKHEAMAARNCPAPIFRLGREKSGRKGENCETGLVFPPWDNQPFRYARIPKRGPARMLRVTLFVIVKNKGLPKSPSTRDSLNHYDTSRSRILCDRHSEWAVFIIYPEKHSTHREMHTISY